MRARHYEIDMCSGPLTGKILRFSLPLMATSILQLLFNAADIVVVGKFASSTALAAVGSTGSLINLIVNMLMGFAIGTSVLVARYYGANDPAKAQKVVHTSMALSVVGGVVIGVVGAVFSRPLLLLMGTPEDVIDKATLYMQIYFIGFPVMAIYNFGSAILRSVGDTKRPLYFLTIAGVINVVLNLVCVIVFEMDVAGVAIPTVVSQAFAAFMVWITLMHSDSMIHMNMRRIRIDRETLRDIVKIGLPAAIQGGVFAISNVIIQASINSFGSIAMAGNSAAGNIEGFIYQAMYTFYQSAVTFTGQNMGAGKIDRVPKVLANCLIMVIIVGLVTGILSVVFGEQLMGVYSNDAEVIKVGVERLELIAVPYVLCGIMDTMVGMVRGLGCSMMPMIVTMIGVVGFRLGWIFTIFQVNHTLDMLYLSYPVSWLVTAAVHILCYIVVFRKAKAAAARELPSG